MYIIASLLEQKKTGTNDPDCLVDLLVVSDAISLDNIRTHKTIRQDENPDRKRCKYIQDKTLKAVCGEGSEWVPAWTQLRTF